MTGDSDHLRAEVSAVVGAGDRVWDRACEDVLRWRVKTRSGFAVDDDTEVVAGVQRIVTARWGPVVITEPVEVVEVLRTPDRVGFSYRTRPGHPVDGEEAFVVHRSAGTTVLTLRSMTRAASQQPWRALFPLLRVAQLVVRRRYLRSLR